MRRVRSDTYTWQTCQVATSLGQAIWSYRNFVESDFWEEDGSAEFEKIWNETESGPYWVEP